MKKAKIYIYQLGDHAEDHIERVKESAIVIGIVQISCVIMKDQFKLFHHLNYSIDDLDKIIERFLTYVKLNPSK